MNSADRQDRFVERRHWISYLAGIFILIGVTKRRLDELEGAGFTAGIVVLGLIMLLYLSEPVISKRFKGYYSIYILFQALLIQVIGLFHEYLDTWVLLYVPLGFQILHHCSRRTALALGAVFTLNSIFTLAYEFGWVSGGGRGITYLFLSIFLLSIDIQYARTEDVRNESQALLAELQSAARKLKESAAQAADLAALKERDRRVTELHDSVGQMLFSIMLTIESACLLLEQDQNRAHLQLDRLQEQTGAALSQMRSLISEWRLEK